MDLKQFKKPFLLPVMICVVVVLPLVIFGLHDSTDLYQHIQFASTFHHSILAGYPYPSWSEEENFGYGSVGMRFYPPLFQFLIALVRIVTGDWHLAICIVLFLFWIAGAYGIFLWTKEFAPEKESTIAACSFLLMPYLLSQVYTSAFYAQACAASVLPFAFLFVTRICRGGKAGNVIGLAISLAIVVLTNLPATVIGSMSLFVYTLTLLERRNLGSTIGKLLSGILLALFATSFYWIRMYPELDLFRNTRFWSDPTFDWREHFLLTPPSKVAFGMWFNNYTLIATILMVFRGIVSSKNVGVPIRPLAILFCFAVFIMTPLSMPLWLYIPYLKEVQFPLRWQVISSIAGAVIFGIGSVGVINSLREKLAIKEPRSWLTAFAFVAVVVVWGQVATKFSKHIIPAKDFSNWAENDINSLGFEFFWTIEAKKEVFAVREKIVAPGRNARIVSWGDGEREFELDPGPEGKARLATLYYPRWQATLNGSRTELSSDENGAMTVLAPPEASKIRVWFQEAWYTQYAKWLSAIAWLVMIFGGIYLLLAAAFLRHSM
ncbi:MAG: 6-pyruvoyl-tetrahydropterin synthase-related protein [Pyrinomonadaceae bacterium]